MRDFRNPRDPLYRSLNNPAYGTGYQSAAWRATNWAWIVAAALSLAFVFVIAFTVGHEPNRVVANMTMPASHAPIIAPNHR